MKKPWFYILLSLASRDRYGSDMQEDVRELSDGAFRLWPATLYGSLEELAERGWIRELDPSEHPDDAGHRSRYYRISLEGRKALTEEVERTESVTRIARRRLEKGRA